MSEFSIQTVIKPTLTYLGLVLIISLPFWALMVFYPIQLLPGLPISALSVLAPTLGAAMLTYKNEDFSGVGHLFSRAFDFRRITNPAWYLPFIMINPLIAFLAYQYLRLTGISLPPVSLTWAVLPMFLFFFIGALAEEIGWTGYMTEPLVYQWGIGKTGIFLGVVWALWHAFSLLQVSRSFAWIGGWALGTISLRVIMVWLHTYSGKSVFAAALFHAIINLCWQLFPVNGSYYDPFVFGVVALVLALGITTLGREVWRRAKISPRREATGKGQSS